MKVDLSVVPCVVPWELVI